ncbi:MAG: SMC-Scp complex subunit ScpB [Roseiflexaceae bacterium]|nr:SMC-Scp complex subunit ScpB [Roseiflexaceae bacterium]
MEQSPLLDIPSPPPPTTVQLIEALLFVASEPVTVTELARALDLPPDAVEQALDDLAAACAGRRRAPATRRADRARRRRRPKRRRLLSGFWAHPRRPSLNGCTGDADHHCLPATDHPRADRSHPRR